MVALLAAVAVALSGKPVDLSCGPLPPYVSRTAYGATMPQPTPAHVWIRPWVCRSAVARQHLGLTVLAHEILYVRTTRPYWWIYRWDDWYAENVVRWKLDRLERRTT